MLGRLVCARLGTNAFVEKTDLNTKRLGDGIQASTGDTVDPALIFVCLLVGDPDQIGQLLLGKPEHDPPFAHPRANITEHGLVGAVRAHAASVEARTGLAVDVRAPANVELDLDIDLQEDLYRIISEALHNVVKHAGATEVTVCVADADAAA